jgi:hypothetical protein
VVGAGVGAGVGGGTQLSRGRAPAGLIVSFCASS